MYRSFGLSTAAIVMVVTGCARHETTSANDPPAALAAAVTGDAVQNIKNGKFILAAPLSDGRPLLTEQQARDIAKFAADSVASLIGHDLVTQHGAPIDFKHLTVCGQAYFAQTPFEALPVELPAEFHNFFGSKWIVGVCDASGRPAISVAVAANAIVPVVRGIFLIPSETLFMVGIPPEWDGPLPVSPETAAILASGKTAKRVSSVPTLFAPNAADAFPQGAVWVFDMDAPVDLKGDQSNVTRSTNRVVFGSMPDASSAMRRGAAALFLPTPDAPRVFPFYVGAGSGRMGADLVVRADASIKFERVVVVTGGKQP